MQSFVQYRKSQLQNQLYKMTVKEAVDRYFDILRLEVLSAIKLPTLLTEGNFIARSAYERACREDYEDNKEIIEFIINTYKKNLYNQIISEAADSTAKTLDDLKKDIEIEVKDLVGKLRTDVLKVISASRPPRADSQKFGGTPSSAGSGVPSGASGGTPSSAGSGVPSGAGGTSSGAGSGVPSGAGGTSSGGAGGGTSSSTKRPEYGTERPELTRDDGTKYKPSPYGWKKPHDSWYGGLKRTIWDPIAGWIAKKTQPFRRRWHDDPMREHSVFLERTFLASFEKLDRLLADFESKVLKVFKTRVEQIAKAVGGKIEVAPTSDLASKKDIVGNDNQTDTIPVTGRPQEKQDSKDDKEYTVDDVLKYKDLDGQEKQDLTPKEEAKIAQNNLQKVVIAAEELGYSVDIGGLHSERKSLKFDLERITQKVEGQENKPVSDWTSLMEDLANKIYDIVVPENHARRSQLTRFKAKLQAIYGYFGENYKLPNKIYANTFFIPLLRDFYDYKRMATPPEPTVNAPESGKTFVANATNNSTSQTQTDLSSEQNYEALLKASEESKNFVTTYPELEKKFEDTVNFWLENGLTISNLVEGFKGKKGKDFVQHIRTLNSQFTSKISGKKETPATSKISKKEETPATEWTTALAEKIDPDYKHLPALLKKVAEKTDKETVISKIEDILANSEDVKTHALEYIFTVLEEPQEGQDLSKQDKTSSGEEKTSLTNKSDEEIKDIILNNVEYGNLISSLDKKIKEMYSSFNPSIDRKSINEKLDAFLNLVINQYRINTDLSSFLKEKENSIQNAKSSNDLDAIILQKDVVRNSEESNNDITNSSEEIDKKK